MLFNRDPIADAISQLSRFRQICVVLFGAILIHLTIGTYHTFGNMLPYMASYIRNYTDASVRIEDLMWIPTAQGCFPFAMVIGGLCSHHLSPRVSALIGCTLVTSSVALSAYAIQHSFGLFFFCYGILFGLGSGIAYVTAVATVINWAPDKIGVVSGIVAAGFGVSSSFFAPLQTWIINPMNFPPNKEGYFIQEELLLRVPSLFTKLAIIYAVMQAIALIFVCDPPKRRSNENNEVEDESPVFENDEDDSLQLSPMQMLKSPTFYFLFASLFCCSFYSNLFYNLYKTFAETFIEDDMFMAGAFSLASVFNAISRIGWGYLTDRLSFQKTLSIATITASALLLTMPMSKEFGEYAYLFWLISMFVVMGATHALFIAATVKCFGRRNKAKNYGIMILSTTLSGILLSAVSQFFLKTIGYTYLFMITSLFPLAAFIIINLIQFTPRGKLVV